MHAANLRIGDDGLPLPLRWRVVVRPRPLVAGLLIDLALEVILQQLGVQVFAWTQIIRALAVGLLLGVLMPSLGLAYVVRRANREIAEARDAATGAGAEVREREAREARLAGAAAMRMGAREDE